MKTNSYILRKRFDRAQYRYAIILALAVLAVWILPTACTKDTIPVTGVTLNPPSVVLLVDATLTLEATVEPADATNKTVTWSTSDERVATVNPAGEVTAVAVGTATITASADNGRFTENCTVTVTDGVVHSIGVTLSPSSVSLLVGAKLTLEAAVEPADATNQTLTWSTSYDRVATVNPAGEVTAVAPGTATITVTADDCRFTAECSVTVAVPNITMITKASKVRISITADTDNLIIDWGDGKESKITDAEIYSGGFIFRHNYSDNFEQRIAIAGENILRLRCSGNLTALDVSGATALTYLDCCTNLLTALDVSRNTALTYLDCVANLLTALDVSSATALTYLSCGYNQLTALDLSKNTALTELYCYNNQLTALDVSRNTELRSLKCYRNQLTTLDVNRNTTLDILLCQFNQLTAMDVSKNIALTELHIQFNQLTALDVSGATALRYLDCWNNQLTDLDVSGATALNMLLCENNQLTASALNDLFRTLPYNRGQISIYNNPGTLDCDCSIAEEKGWIFF